MIKWIEYDKFSQDIEKHIPRLISNGHFITVGVHELDAISRKYRWFTSRGQLISGVTYWAKLNLPIPGNLSEKGVEGIGRCYEDWEDSTPTFKEGVTVGEGHISKAIREFMPTLEQRAGYEALVSWLESVTSFESEGDKEETEVQTLRSELDFVYALTHKQLSSLLLRHQSNWTLKEMICEEARRAESANYVDRLDIRTIECHRCSNPLDSCNCGRGSHNV